MTGNVVNFPGAGNKIARPAGPEWSEQIGFTPFISIGIDKVQGEDTFIVWQQVQDHLDCVACPSQDVAAALLTHLFGEIYYSAALDNVGADRVSPEVASYHLRQVLKRLKPFASILEESGFRHVDDLIDYRKHAAQVEAYVEQSRLDDDQFHARLAAMEAARRAEA